MTVVTTLAADHTPHGFTANSFTSVSAEPPLILVCIDLRCSILSHFQICNSFAINVLSERQRDLSVRFAGLVEGRFEGVPWSPGQTGSPVLGGTIAALECRIEQRVPAGDHIILIGEVLFAATFPGEPLVYFGSEYRFLATGDQS